jgi:tryptophan-rich sensory protein
MKMRIESSTSYRGRNSRPNLPLLALLVALALAAEVLAYAFSHAAGPQTMRWYGALAKPVWLPPQRWFAPIWTALYVSMGSAVWLIWRERYHRDRARALVAYALQLLLNASWAPLFFGLHDIGASLFVCVVLWISIAWTVREFARIRQLAAIMMLPYLIWVGVATVMNLSLWKLNP